MASTAQLWQFLPYFALLKPLRSACGSTHGVGASYTSAAASSVAGLRVDARLPVLRLLRLLAVLLLRLWPLLPAERFFLFPP